MNFKLIQLSDRIFTGLVLAIVASVLALSGALIRFDNLYYDLGRHFSFKTAPDDIVIIAIDEASQNSLGRWPWPRSLQTKLMNKLSSAQARVISWDVVFSEPEPNGPGVDQANAEVIGRTGNVVMPAALAKGAFVNSVSGRLVFHDKRKVNFLGQPGKFPRISYAKVLSGEYPADFFKDKIVLIGAAAESVGDAMPSSVSALSQPLPDVEFHANAIVAMQHDELVVDAPLWLTSLLCALLAMVPLFWLHKFSPFKSLLTIVVYFFAVMLLLVSLPHLLHIWIAPSGALVAILLAYPIWSWRRLDSAQVFLDRELQRLRDELASLGMELKDAPEEADEDPLQSRISKVKLAAKHLRKLHRGRNDTLAFISHDIRAPLGAAMMMLNEFEDNKHAERMKRMLGRAYDMAEGFLQASRAEMANVNKFQELDMVSIVQQAVDDVYEIAIIKQLKLTTDFPENSLWVRGDFGLLLRAVTNILINAVNYSPERGVIEVKLSGDKESLTLEVTDQGPGIPAAKASKLFRRFSRVDAEHQSREGSGLGLYFVDVTIKKHRGSVSVNSQLGQGATFIISLPLERRRQNQPVKHDRRAAPVASFNDTI